MTKPADAPPSRAEWAELLYCALIKSRYGALPAWDDEPDGAGSERICWLLAWAELEGTNAGFNPLATTLELAGSTDFNSAGVQSYPDLATGIQAVVDTLTGHDADSRGYTAIIDAILDEADSFDDFRDAVARSAWSGLAPASYQIPRTFAVSAIPGSTQ